MARFHAVLPIEALPRSWVEEYVHGLFARAERLSLDEEGWVEGVEELADVTLVEGEHLTRGARYQRHIDELDADGQIKKGGGTTTELVLTSWDSKGETSADITTWLDNDGKITWSAQLDGRETFSATGAYAENKRWRQLDWAVRLSLGQWWRMTERQVGPGRAEPAMATLRHQYGTAVLKIKPKPAGSGRWQVTVTLTVRGRGLTRPLATVALLAVKRRIRVEFRKVVTDMARQWNEKIPELRECDPREAELWLPVVRANQSELDDWIAEQSGGDT